MALLGPPRGLPGPPQGPRGPPSGVRDRRQGLREAFAASRNPWRRPRFRASAGLGCPRAPVSKIALGSRRLVPLQGALTAASSKCRARRVVRARVRLIVLLRSPSARAFAPPFAARARVLGASGRRPGRPSCTLLSSAYAIRPPQPIELHRVPLAWPTRRGALNSDCNVGRSARQCCCRAQWLRHRAVARARLGSCGRRGARQCPSRL